MNKQVTISIIVMAVMSLMLGFVVHAILLDADYKALPNIYRGEEDSAGYMPFMMLAHAMIGVGLVWVYRQGREAGDWLMQGVRFGMAVAVLSTIPVFLVYYSVQPLPGMLVAKQIVFDSIGMLLMGVVVAWLNRPAAA